ncbi:glycosyltransferase [Halorubrum sp. JWXQ-INN 858]|uniref:glycosyltransferase n=1 Tax=Halorubrum sp. JWXQ-INN 858 TaxID=2690782 RepID=UPI001357DF53|nr:glycosyltransferase [Halorubrum sp. JWXQ-INN 858]MWV64368.1 glycosyltransferase [Halorubrum sp. JWXQ-INN 858]
MESVVAFTDTYLPTVNGVTYTVKTWRDRWTDRGGRMDVVYPNAPRSSGGVRAPPTAPGEFPVPSVPFPFYPGFRAALPAVPDAVADGDYDVVHAHTPFALGLAARRFARRRDRPLVASYHTPTAEYARYLVERPLLQRGVRAAAAAYERRYFGAADAVVAPSETTANALREALAGVADAPRVHAVGNGVDLDRFSPADPAAVRSFRDRYGLGDGPLVGYTGRHGHEKRLDELLAAVAGLDREVTLVLGGDGPARAGLEATATRLGVDARFLGFLPREELPTYYTALDAFCFPSPVETQGLVAMEATACGTPVVGVDAGALVETVVEGVTGTRYPPGDVDAFRDAIGRVLDDGDRLRASCLDAREALSLDAAIDALAEVYASVTSGGSVDNGGSADNGGSGRGGESADNGGSGGGGGAGTSAGARGP